MKKFWAYLIYIVMLTGIYFLVGFFVNPNCSSCGDKIYGDRYHVEGTSEVLCESCGRSPFYVPAH